KKDIVSIEELLTYLSKNEEQRTVLKKYISDLLQKRKFSRMLSDTGILRDSDFMYEVKKRISAKLLPFQPEEDTLEFVLNQVFYKSSDPIWISTIPFEELQQLFDIISFESIFNSTSDKSVLSEVMIAMGLI